VTIGALKSRLRLELHDRMVLVALAVRALHERGGDGTALIPKNHEKSLVSELVGRW
jgi:hypothetical protein